MPVCHHIISLDAFRVCIADDEESDADSGQTDGSEEEAAAKEGSGATDSDVSLAEESHLKRAKQHQKHALARQTVSAPQPANGRTQQLLQLQQQQHRQGIGVQKSGVAGVPSILIERAWTAG